MIAKHWKTPLGALALAMLGSLAAAGESGGERLFDISSRVPVTFYGYVKLDAAWDDSRINGGNIVKWVLSEEINKNDEEFNMTAKQTRLGLKLGPVDAGGSMKVSGLLELDFYGRHLAENKPGPRVRHAFAKLDWPEYDFSVLAGQYWDVAHPLLPKTVNNCVLWWNGNIAFRRPQLRLTKGFDLGDGVIKRFELQAAALRTIGEVGGFDPGDTGEDSGAPSLQYRAALSLRLLTDKPTVVGVSGLWGKEEYDVDALDTHEKFESTSMGLDLVLPLTDWLALKGEVWTGKNLDAYNGGIGQGVNVAEMQYIHSTGAWAMISVDPIKKLNVNLGYGVDDPDNDDLNDGQRHRSSIFVANAWYSMGAGVSLALEYLYMETDYLNQADGIANRLQFAVIYKF